MIKDIVFDFGGVLTTIDPNVALKRFAALGVENPGEMINSYCQKGAFFALENGDITAVEFCHELSAMCNREISIDEAKHAWMGFIVEVHTYLLEFLQSLRGKYRLSVLSNTNPFIQSWACSPEFTPEGKSLKEYFDMLFFSFELNSSKPSHEIYLKMLEQGKMVAHETLFLDDGVKNINAAAELGIKTLKVENGGDWRKALQDILEKY